MMSLRLRRTLLGVVLAVFAVCAAGVLAPAARADGDPGSDVLVYQNLFVAADANISIPQQVELGNLLTSADQAGFPVRVAIISQPADLGAITALWRKPAAYANFLGTELSLAYAQRLLIVMPDGFGFNWQGHSATAAYRVLDGLRIGPAGPAWPPPPRPRCAALAQASGVRLAAAGQRQRGRGRGRRHGRGATAQGTRSGGRPAVTSAPSGSQVPLIAGIALAVLIVAAAGWLARLPRRGPAAEAAAAAGACLRRRGSAGAASARHSRYLARGRVRGRGGLADRRARGDPASG